MAPPLLWGGGWVGGWADLKVRPHVIATSIHLDRSCHYPARTAQPALPRRGDELAHLHPLQPPAGRLPEEFHLQPEEAAREVEVPRNEPRLG